MKWMLRLTVGSGLGLVMTAQAGVYTCTDLSGHKVYSDRPCPGAKSEVLELPVAPPGDSAAGQGNGLRPGEEAMLERRREREQRHRETVRQSSLEEAARNRAAEAERRRNERDCRRYEDRLETARSRQRQGYTRREGEQIERDLRSYQAKVDRYCK
jgi:hypothetical protein